MMEQKQPVINILLSFAVAGRIATNRKLLASIIDTVNLCGRQGVALQGHSDTNQDILKDLKRNPGNFISFLRYRAAGGEFSLQSSATSLW